MKLGVRDVVVSGEKRREENYSEGERRGRRLRREGGRELSGRFSLINRVSGHQNTKNWRFTPKFDDLAIYTSGSFTNRQVGGSLR